MGAIYRPIYFCHSGDYGGSLQKPSTSWSTLLLSLPTCGLVCDWGLRLMNWQALGKPHCPGAFPIPFPERWGTCPTRRAIGTRLVRGEGRRLRGKGESWEAAGRATSSKLQAPSPKPLHCVGSHQWHLLAPCTPSAKGSFSGHSPVCSL